MSQRACEVFGAREESKEIGSRFWVIFYVRKELADSDFHFFFLFGALARLSLSLSLSLPLSRLLNARGTHTLSNEAAEEAMSDVKDILGVARGGGGAAPALPPGSTSSIATAAAPAAAAAAALGNRQPREVRPPRPAGMSREAYALLDG